MSWLKWTEAKAAETWDALLCALRDLGGHMRDVATGTTGTARTLAYQYGVPPVTGTARLAPRSMTALPFITEADLTATTTLDLLERAGRHAFAGYVANLGDVPIHVAWLGVDGGNSGLWTLPAGTTVQLPCIVRGVIVAPIDGQQGGRYQVSFS